MDYKIHSKLRIIASKVIKISERTMSILTFINQEQLDAGSACECNESDCKVSRRSAGRHGNVARPSYI